MLYINKQASAHEACNRTRTSMHTPKTLEAWKKIRPCLIKKASRCADRTSKTNVFYVPLSLKYKRSYEKIMCIYCFIGSVVKIVLYLHLLYRKDDRLRQM